MDNVQLFPLSLSQCLLCVVKSCLKFSHSVMRRKTRKDANEFVMQLLLKLSQLFFCIIQFFFSQRIKKFLKCASIVVYNVFQKIYFNRCSIHHFHHSHSLPLLLSLARSAKVSSKNSAMVFESSPKKLFLQLCWLHFCVYAIFPSLSLSFTSEKFLYFRIIRQN